MVAPISGSTKSGIIYWEVSQIVALPFGKIPQFEDSGMADTEERARDKARRVIVAAINTQVEKERAGKEEREGIARSRDDHSREHADDASENDMLAAWYANEEDPTTQSVTVEDIENREELLDPGTGRERRGVTWVPGWRWEYYTEDEL